MFRGRTEVETGSGEPFAAPCLDAYRMRAVPERGFSITAASLRRTTRLLTGGGTAVAHPPSWADTGRAMSQENVEIARRANAAFNGADFVEFGEYLHPDVTFTDQANAADVAATIEGKAAVLALCSEWGQAFDGFRAEISEYVDAGDQVVCATRWVGKGKQSAAVVDVSQVDVYAFRDGKLVEVTLAYPDKPAALEAVGLRE